MRNPVPVAQRCPFFLFVWGRVPPKVNQPKKDAFFSPGHWASELSQADLLVFFETEPDVSPPADGSTRHLAHWALLEGLLVGVEAASLKRSLFGSVFLRIPFSWIERETRRKQQFGGFPCFEANP